MGEHLKSWIRGVLMGFAIVNSENVWQKQWSSFVSNLRTLQDGESVIECEWDAENNWPVGVTMPEAEAAFLPDWRSFQTAITVSSAFLRIAGYDGRTLAILPTLVYVCGLIESDATRMIQFAGLWNAIAAIAEPTTEEITALNAIASINNVPLLLNSAGLIT